MVNVRQGEIYWLDDEEPFGSEPGFRRPWVVVQNNLANSTRIGTILACPLSSNLRGAGAPGNVVLQPRESGLRLASVVIVSGLSARDRSLFDTPVSQLGPSRVTELIAGIIGFLVVRGP